MKVWRQCSRATVGPALVKAKVTFTANEKELIISGPNGVFNSVNERKIVVPAGTYGILEKGGVIEFYSIQKNKHNIDRKIEQSRIDVDEIKRLILNFQSKCTCHIKSEWRNLLMMN